MMQELPPDANRENLTNTLLSDATRLLNCIVEGFEPQAAAAIYQNLRDGAHLTLKLTVLPQPAILAVMSSPDGEKTYTIFRTQIPATQETSH